MSKTPNHGFGLLEVLISMALLTIVCLGITRLELTAYRRVQHNFNLSLATQLASNTLEYYLSARQWPQDNSVRSLPAGQRTVLTTSSDLQVMIRWQEIGTANPNQITLQAPSQ